MTLVYGFPLDENNVMDSIFNYNTFSVYIRQSLWIELWSIGEVCRIYNEGFMYCFPAADDDHIPAQYPHTT